MFQVLSISLDRDLLDESCTHEAQRRQLIYCDGIPCRTTVVAKTPPRSRHEAPDLGEALQVFPCPVRHWLLFPLKALRVCARLCRERHFDVVQAQEPYLTGLIALWVKRRWRLPFVVGVFNDEIGNPVWLRERWRHRLAAWMGRIVLRHADVIRTDSEAVACRLKSQGFDRVIFVPFLITHAETLSAPDPGASSLRETLLAGRAGPLLLTVARLERQKNIPLLLEAMEVLARPAAQLVVVGDGTLRGVLEKKARDRGLTNICFWGYVPAELLRQYYQAADLFILSSNHESSARVLTEALLAGTPVLTTNTAGARDVVEDGVSGRIVPPGDSAALANTLRELCDGADCLEGMGERGRRAMLARVSRENVVSGLREVYAVATGGNHKQADRSK